MNDYLILNIVLISIAIVATFILSVDKKAIIIALKVGSAIALMTYPWDYFAIGQGIWFYPKNPGLELFNVPLNDMLNIFTCTYMSCIALSCQGIRFWQFSQRKS